MKWITNEHRSNAKECIAELTRWKHRNLVIGKPKTNGVFPVGGMILAGMVGIYDDDQDEEQTEED